MGKIGCGIVNPKFGEMIYEILANHPTDETWDALGNLDEGIDLP